MTPLTELNAALRVAFGRPAPEQQTTGPASAAAESAIAG
jgi:hypothetical protein